jgi:hypothetical protein
MSIFFFYPKYHEHLRQLELVVYSVVHLYVLIPQQSYWFTL